MQLADTPHAVCSVGVGRRPEPDGHSKTTIVFFCLKTFCCHIVIIIQYRHLELRPLVDSKMEIWVTSFHVLPNHDLFVLTCVDCSTSSSSSSSSSTSSSSRCSSSSSSSSRRSSVGSVLLLHYHASHPCCALSTIRSARSATSNALDELDAAACRRLCSAAPARFRGLASRSRPPPGLGCKCSVCSMLRICIMSMTVFMLCTCNAFMCVLAQLFNS